MEMFTLWFYNLWYLHWRQSSQNDDIYISVMKCSSILFLHAFTFHNLLNIFIAVFHVLLHIKFQATVSQLQYKWHQSVIMENIQITL